MDQVQSIKMEVIVRKTIFYNPDNGYTVAKVYPKESPDPGRDWFHAKGVIGKVHEEERITLTGTWGSDPKYGRQFEASSIELPDLRQGGVDIFLKHGFLKGIGPALGDVIYKTFGDEVLSILDDDPERLLEIKGIGESKLKDIKASWIETRGRREALSFFSKWNVRPATINKILARWPNVRDAIQTVKENPFILAWEIKGIGFALADKIAETMGIPRDSKRRIEAAVGYTLDEAANNEGHCYLPRPELLVRVADFLNPRMKENHPQETFDLINECMEFLAIEQKVVMEEDRIYLKVIHATECKLADNIRRLRSFQIDTDTRAVNSAITEFETVNGITLHEFQRRAVAVAATEKVAIITGGPGTGKTTIIKCLLYVCNKLSMGTIKLGGPTGKAAQRMQESCGKDASTIHRLLGFGQGGMKHNEKNPLNTAMLICDESSMIDLYLGKATVCSLPDPARLVLIGDIDQLPSVRAGNVLKDLIRSGNIPVVYLTEVYRQSQSSFIPHNARAVLEGKSNLLNFKEAGDSKIVDDSFLMPVPLSEGEGHKKRELEPEERGFMARKYLTKAVIALIQKRGYTPQDIMVLSPTRRGMVGVDALNELMQSLLNSGGQPIGNSSFRVGDRVMQKRNNYDKDVFNGDQGYITSCSFEADIVSVRYGGRVIPYEVEELNQIQLAYVITVHKSQGMESPAVIQMVSLSQAKMLNRNILYTGITRAKEFCLLIGEKKAIGLAVWKNEAAMRYTTLAQRV